MSIPTWIRITLATLLALDSTASASPAFREGDIVFSSSKRGQGEAIIAATGSAYTHCGIVFQKDGRLMVLEAVQPVGIVSLEEFRSRGTPGTFLARRLKLPLAPEKYQSARAWAQAQVGKNYDPRFMWDDENLYCSELVWKIYQHAGIELCAPRRFRDYDLAKPAVRKIIEERFGGMAKVPLDEKVVAPSDLASSPLLAEVTSP
ncbi:MAG: YiiX/YebB-like N1pC/P60 family cysteine hydrolase [Verrucomicrobiota bacterium]